MRVRGGGIAVVAVYRAVVFVMVVIVIVIVVVVFVRVRDAVGMFVHVYVVVVCVRFHATSFARRRPDHCGRHDRPKDSPPGRGNARRR
ncbi:MAG: hypothetical protein NVSMB21_07500 [Vulcanimicrobiaceae bacterium]